LIAYFLSNISAKYYENPTMLSRVIAKNIGDVFFETQCRDIILWYDAKHISIYWTVRRMLRVWQTNGRTDGRTDFFGANNALNYVAILSIEILSAPCDINRDVSNSLRWNFAILNLGVMR